MNLTPRRLPRRKPSRACKPGWELGVDTSALTMGQAVNRVLTRFGLEQQLWLSRLAGEWARYVGAPVAAHTRPGSFDKTAGSLCIFVDSSVWLSELKRYGKQQLLANLQHDFPQVKTVRLQADPGK